MMSGNVAVQFACLMAVEQVGQAVVVARDENRHLGAVAGQCQPPLHFELGGNGRKQPFEIRNFQIELFQIPFHPHQK